jgi:hypothetical protein
VRMLVLFRRDRSFSAERSKHALTGHQILCNVCNAKQKKTTALLSRSFCGIPELSITFMLALEDVASKLTVTELTCTTCSTVYI